MTKVIRKIISCFRFGAAFAADADLDGVCTAPADANANAVSEDSSPGAALKVSAAWIRYISPLNPLRPESATV